MKISPVSSGVPPSMDIQGNPAPSRVDSVRTLKMKVNATPLTGDPGADPQMRPISDNNETSATVEATQPLSPQIALLAKQRRALQVRQRELEAREKALQSRSTENPTIDLARLKSEPLSVLLENGVTYDQLTESLLANQGNREFNDLKAELKALREGVDQKFTEKDAQAEQQVYAEMRREADQLTSSEDFELIRETRSVPTVMKLIERTYKESGEVLDVSEAMKLVEDELFKDVEKLTRLKKIQGQNPMAQQMQPQQRQTGMRTLTNRDTASVPMSAKQRALAAFYGTLKR